MAPVCLPLAAGTPVSAKYKHLFCEAEIKHVERDVQFKVTLKTGLVTTEVPENRIQLIQEGTPKVGDIVRAKVSTEDDFLDAVVNRVEDFSVYTVEFSDGDVRTVNRKQLRLKGDRAFKDGLTLSGSFPFLDPEKFSRRLSDFDITSQIINDAVAEESSGRETAGNGLADGQSASTSTSSPDVPQLNRRSLLRAVRTKKSMSEIEQEEVPQLNTRTRKPRASKNKKKMSECEHSSASLQNNSSSTTSEMPVVDGQQVGATPKTETPSTTVMDSPAQIQEHGEKEISDVEIEYTLTLTQRIANGDKAVYIHQIPKSNKVTLENSKKELSEALNKWLESASFTLTGNADPGTGVSAAEPVIENDPAMLPRDSLLQNQSQIDANVGEMIKVHDLIKNKTYQARVVEIRGKESGQSEEYFVSYRGKKNSEWIDRERIVENITRQRNGKRRSTRSVPRRTAKKAKIYPVETTTSSSNGAEEQELSVQNGRNDEPMTAPSTPTGMSTQEDPETSVYLTPTATDMDTQEDRRTSVYLTPSTPTSTGMHTQDELRTSVYSTPSAPSELSHADLCVSPHQLDHEYCSPTKKSPDRFNKEDWHPGAFAKHKKQAGSNNASASSTSTTTTNVKKSSKVDQPGTSTSSFVQAEPQPGTSASSLVQTEPQAGASTSFLNNIMNVPKRSLWDKIFKK